MSSRTNRRGGSFDPGRGLPIGINPPPPQPYTGPYTGPSPGGPGMDDTTH